MIVWNHNITIHNETMCKRTGSLFTACVTLRLHKKTIVNNFSCDSSVNIFSCSCLPINIDHADIPKISVQYLKKRKMKIHNFNCIAIYVN